MRSSSKTISYSEETLLIEKLKQKDPASFEHLVNHYGGYMLSIARRYLGNEYDAQDAVQDAYLQAFKAINHFEGRSSLKSWLHRIITNSALMSIRGNTRRKIELLADDPNLFDKNGKRIVTENEISLSVEEIAIDKEKSAFIRTQIDCLPSTSRHLILLRDIDGYSTKETSELLGISIASVKTGLHRARQALKKSLEHQPNTYDIDMSTLNKNVSTQKIQRITCKEFETFIIDFIDERLSEEQQVIFNTHIEECDHCKTYIADYQKSITLSQAAFKEPDNTTTSINENEIPEELVQAILKANKK